MVALLSFVMATGILSVAASREDLSAVSWVLLALAAAALAVGAAPALRAVASELRAGARGADPGLLTLVAGTGVVGTRVAAAGDRRWIALGLLAAAAAAWVVLLPAVKPAPEPEVEGPPAGATVWLNSPSVDPTPPAKRLSAKFARRLQAMAKGQGLDWAFVLGVLRAKGASGKTPVDPVTLRKLTARFATAHEDRGAWAAR